VEIPNLAANKEATVLFPVPDDPPNKITIINFLEIILAEFEKSPMSYGFQYPYLCN